jgi:photosystem II stability/assembly factor-like uncharacterized protein
MAMSSDECIYVGTKSGGIYKTINGGKLWFPVNDGLINIDDDTFYSISIASDSTIYIGSRKNEIYRSTDRGESWVNKSNNLPNTYIWNTQVNSVGDVFAVASGNGVYRSTDRGENWIQIINGMNNINVSDISLNGNDNLFASTIGGGIFLSTNNGDSWYAINNGLPNLECYNVNFVKERLIFTSIDDDLLYRSTNNGNSWHQAGNGLEELFVGRIAINFDGNLYAGTFNGVYKSTNLGINWSSVNEGIKYTITRTVEIDSNSVIYIGTFGEGVLKSKDNGKSWFQENKGLNNSFVRCLANNGARELYAGTSGGVFRTSDFGDKWEALLKGLDDTEVRAIAVNSAGKVFAGTWYEGIYILDENNQWIQSNNGINQSRISVRALTIDENDWIYAGLYYSGGVYRSTDNGNSWHQSLDAINILEILSIKDSLLFAGGYGLYRSTDYGESWELCAFDGKPINGIARDKFGRALVIADYQDGVYISSDRGYSWSSMGLEGGNKQSITVSDNGLVYVGTGNGVYRKINDGFIWEHLLDGMTHLYSAALICNNDNTVFAGTLGGGVYRSIDYSTSIKNDSEIKIDSYHMSQNYPNPFNPVTTIKYKIPELSYVKLKVYDVLGNEVATLVNEEKPSGNYEDEWDATGLPSGIYFYRLHDFIKIRRRRYEKNSNNFNYLIFNYLLHSKCW